MMNIKQFAVGPLTWSVWEQDLAVRLLRLGVRSCQILTICPSIKRARMTALAHEIDSGTVRRGRTPGISDICATFYSCCHVSLATVCYRRASEILKLRGEIRDGHFGERVALTIQYYNALASNARRLFGGDDIFEICRAYEANQMIEFVCQDCMTWYATSYNTALKLRCPFCAHEERRIEVRRLRKATQEQMLKIGKTA